MPEVIFHHLKLHFRVLNLAERYRLMALDHRLGQYRALMRMYGTAKNAAGVSNGLLEKVEYFAADQGENYWHAVMLVFR